ncbi:aquaporin [Cellulomonas shaoxiangyii]|uniref:MIP family channel protein n=1 Tax=Cellulomonas shaoxiangyii TaxID=2566013 RepID=A0A4P7SIT9_9CELL|nr:aquaporin [Cellulomonas shaoxiangyii]QCB92996.1 MIP family channel protein [Cellulomonas shaoxiangyii]TGY85587.1 MIP family channel protein [Cellulomonas shaoxiangyii]
MSQQNPDVPEGTPKHEGTTPAAETTVPAAAAGTPVPAAPGAGTPASTEGTTAADAGATAADAPRATPAATEVVEEDVYVVPAGTVVTAAPGLLARLGAEAVGSFFIVLAGVGIALYATFSNVGGGLAVALGFGIALLASIVAFGAVSGGHFNPAVTLGACLAGRTPFRDLLPYWLAQVVGAALAAAVLYLTIPPGLPALVSQSGDTSRRGLFSGAANGFDEHSPLARLSGDQAEFTLVTALLVEVVATAVLVGVILGATDRRAHKAHVPFAVGLSYAALLLVAFPVTNGSLNPARSLAAAIFSESWALEQVWLFWVAPLLGAAVAALIYRAFATEPTEDSLFGEDETYVVEDDVVVVDERRA